MSEQKMTYDQKVIDFITTAYEQGNSDLQQNYPTAPPLPPCNGVTGREYSSYNAVLLKEVMRDRGTLDPRFLTANQAQQLGATLKEGAQPIEIATWMTDTTRRAVRDETGEVMRNDEGKPITEVVELERPRFKLTPVHPASDFENLPAMDMPQRPTMTAEAVKDMKDRANKNFDAILEMADKGENADLIGPYVNNIRRFKDRQAHTPIPGSLDEKKNAYQTMLANSLLATKTRSPGKGDLELPQKMVENLRQEPNLFFRTCRQADNEAKLVMTFGQDKALDQILTEEKERRDAENAARIEARRNSRSNDNEDRKSNYIKPEDRQYLGIHVRDKESQAAAKEMGARFDGVRRDRDGNETPGTKLWYAHKDNEALKGDDNQGLKPFVAIALDGASYENREEIKAQAKENGTRVMWNAETRTMFAIGSAAGLSVSANQDVEQRFAAAKALYAERDAKQAESLQNRQYLYIAPYDDKAQEAAKELGARFDGVRRDSRGRETPGTKLWFVEGSVPKELEQHAITALDGITHDTKDAVKTLAADKGSSITWHPETESWYAVGGTAGVEAYVAKEQNIEKRFEQAKIIKAARAERQAERDAKTKYIDVPYKDKESIKELGAANGIAVFFEPKEKRWKAMGDDLTPLSKYFSVNQQPIPQNNRATVKEQVEGQIGAKINSEDMDGKPHSYTDKNNVKGTYRVDREGNGEVAQTDKTAKIMPTDHTLTQDEKSALRAEEHVSQEVGQAERAAEQEKAMKRAYAIWKNAEVMPGQNDPNIKQDKDGNPIVPGFDDRGRLLTLINPTPNGPIGLKGCPQKNAHYILGGPEALKQASSYAVVADFEKAKAMHAEKGIPVICAFRDRAVGSVADIYAKKYPDKQNVMDPKAQAQTKTQGAEKGDGGAER